ncbi:unnamed protein product [Parajaminaea phylloscopi]
MPSKEQEEGVGHSSASTSAPRPALRIARSGVSTGTATPDSIASLTDGQSTPGSESGGELVATSTVTTEFSRRRADKLVASQVDVPEGEATSNGPVRRSQTTTITHVGASNLQHQVDKDGAIHLKPQQSASAKRKGKKIRAVVSFKPRHSRFDRSNEQAAKDPFRGFYTLFWIGMGILMLNTFYTTFTSTGRIISLTFANLFSRDARVLAMSDAVLVGSLFLCVPYVKALKRGWMRYWPTGTIVQHAWQGAMLACVIKWARYREWPWVQSGFFVLHTLSMMMKMHSYLAVNGNMSRIYHKLHRIEQQLEERVLEVQTDSGVGDDASADKTMRVPESKAEARKMRDELMISAWNRAVVEAHKNCNAGDDEAKILLDEADDAPREWAQLELQRGMGTARHKAFPGTLIRSRTDSNGTNSYDSAFSAGNGSSPDDPVRDPHPLFTHSDRVIAVLAREIEALREELMSVPPAKPDGIPDAAAEDAGGKENRVCWPDNVTYANFLDYLLVPTLVYELEYPRTKSIRPLYVLEKTLATFGTFFVIYVITEHFIIPHSPTPDTPLLQALLKLALPMMINYLLIFYIMFECVCNGFAELTRFADREFYQDWWNATSMDVFSRKWNKPVHSFLLKHVYASSIAGWGIGKTWAMLLTFLLSAFLHELVMAIVSGKIRGYLFFAQMCQIPMILMSKIPFIRDNETLGNLIFWIGLMAGFPLLNIGYLMY